jgi:hypothetical protein
MFENDMPARRQFNLFPSPETVVGLGFRAAKYLAMAGVLYFCGTWALHHIMGSAEVRAENHAPQVAAVSVPRRPASAPAEEMPAARVEEEPRYAGTPPRWSGEAARAGMDDLVAHIKGLTPEWHGREATSGSYEGSPCRAGGYHNSWGFCRLR